MSKTNHKPSNSQYIIRAKPTINHQTHNTFNMASMNHFLIIRPSWDGPYYVIGYGNGRAGVHTGFRTITLVLYIGYLPNLATWFPCGRGRTLFIFGSLPLYRLIIYIDGCIWKKKKKKKKNPIYFGVIRSKVKVTVTINRIFDNRIVSAR